MIRGTRLEDKVDWLGVRLADPQGPLGQRIGPFLAEWLWRLTGLWKNGSEHERDGRH